MALKRVSDDFVPPEKGGAPTLRRDTGQYGTPSWAENYAKSISDDSQQSWLGSAARGFNRPFEKLAHGVVDPIASLFSDNWAQKADQQKLKEAYELKKAREQNPSSATAGEFLGNVGLSLPFMYGGGGVANKVASEAPKWLTRLAGGGAGLGLMGALSDPEKGGTRAQGALEEGLLGLAGGAVGEALGPAFKAARKIPNIKEGIYAQGGLKDPILASMLKRLSPEELEKGVAASKSAKELGLTLTPAEATGSAPMANLEAELGVNLGNERRLIDFKEGQRKLQQRSVDSLLDDISKKGTTSYAEKGRDLAQGYLDKLLKNAQEESNPFYRKADFDRVGKVTLDKNLKPQNETLNNLLKDSNIDDSYQYVTKSKKYKTDLEGYSPDSIKVLQQTKINLDEKIADAAEKGRNNDVRIFTKSKNKLLDEMTKASSNYSKANKIYEEAIIPLEKLKKGELGKLSRMEDVTLQNFTKNLFDSNETNKEVLNQVRDIMYKEDPEVWNALIRNEMQRRIKNAPQATKYGNPGTGFYNSVLVKDKDMFKQALSNNPSAARKLDLMHDAFKNVINPKSARSESALTKTSMNKSRSDTQEIKRLINKVINGKYDDTAIDIITSPTWDSEIARISAIKNKDTKTRAVLDFLEDVTNKGGKSILGKAPIKETLTPSDTNQGI